MFLPRARQCREATRKLFSEFPLSAKEDSDNIMWRCQRLPLKYTYMQVQTSYPLCKEVTGVAYHVRLDHIDFQYVRRHRRKLTITTYSRITWEIVSLLSSPHSGIIGFCKGRHAFRRSPAFGVWTRFWHLTVLCSMNLREWNLNVGLFHLSGFRGRLRLSSFFNTINLGLGTLIFKKDRPSHLLFVKPLFLRHPPLPHSLWHTLLV